VICSAPFLLAVALLFLYKIDKSMESRIERELGERRLQARKTLNPTFIE
jgi:GPH family glycoside/pentoside/hexuronide:cation symporter